MKWFGLEGSQRSSHSNTPAMVRDTFKPNLGLNTSRDSASTISLSNLFHPSNLLCLLLRKGSEGVLLLARAHMSKPGSFGAGEEQPHAAICPSDLFRGGGEDALLQPEGLRQQRLPQLVPGQAGLELQRQEAMSSDGGTWPCTPQPTSPTLCTASSVLSGWLR